MSPRIGYHTQSQCKNYYNSCDLSALMCDHNNQSQTQFDRNEVRSRVKLLSYITDDDRTVPQDNPRLSLNRGLSHKFGFGDIKCSSTWKVTES